MAETEHADFFVNKERSQRICLEDNCKVPNGMTMYSTDVAFGVNYKAPQEAPGANFGVTVKFNQDEKSFILEANDACEALYRLAKATNKRYEEVSNDIKW